MKHTKEAPQFPPARRFAHLLVPLCMLVLLGCPSTLTLSVPLQQPEMVPAKGPWRHESSGMVFPDTIGDWRRTDVRRYDTHGYDVGASYRLPRPWAVLVATIYVYPRSVGAMMTSEGTLLITEKMPRPALEEAMFEQSKEQVMHRPDIKLIEEHAVSLQQRGQVHTGKAAVFEFPQSQAGVTQQIRSHLLQFTDPMVNWVIKYRFSHDREVPAAADMQDLMDRLEWTFADSR